MASRTGLRDTPIASASWYTLYVSPGTYTPSRMPRRRVATT